MQRKVQGIFKRAGIIMQQRREEETEWKRRGRERERVLRTMQRIFYDERTNEREKERVGEEDDRDRRFSESEGAEGGTIKYGSSFLPPSPTD